MIPDDSFRVVRGTGRECGVIVLLLEVGDGGKPISGKGVCMGVGWKGRECVAKQGSHDSLGGEHMLKRGGYR